MELVRIEKFVGQPVPQRWGRKLLERRAMARAFVGKAVYNHPTTRATLEGLRTSPIFRRICGFVSSGDIPSEATFSRAFAEFAEKGLGDRIHEALVARCVKPELVGHISRDATAIRGREKPVAKAPVKKPVPRKKGRPRRGEVREPKAETRLEHQFWQSVAEALAELPVYCDVGTNRNLLPIDGRGLILTANFHEFLKKLHQFLLILKESPLPPCFSNQSAYSKNKRWVLTPVHRPTPTPSLRHTLKR